MDDAAGEVLAGYGWDRTWQARWDALALTGHHLGHRPGRVRRVDRGECDVVTGRGDERVASDSMRAQRDLAPVTGDWVAVADDPDVGPIIAAIVPRGGALVRRDPAEAEVDQVIVANVDLVGVACGADRPVRLGRIERFLVLAADSGAEGFVVMTKADVPRRGEGWDTLASDLGDVPVLTTSARTGEGLDELQRMLAPHRTLVLVGESGAGKSSLVNRLVGADVQDVGAVRSTDAAGRHTTRARELVLVPGGGVLIDTPGMRTVGLWDAWPALDHVFGDVVDVGTRCRFNDCAHHVEPGCAVHEAVAAGTLGMARVQRYLRLVEELVAQDRRRDEQRRTPRRRR